MRFNCHSASMLLNRLLLFISFSFDLFSLSWADPCSLPRTEFVIYDQAIRCLDSFPFNAEIASSILDSLSKTIKLYVFRDIAAGYKDQSIESHIDIVASLDSLKGIKNYRNDREFHDALYDLFLSLNDAHTRYSTACYHGWKFYQPWVLSSVFEDGKNNIIIQEPVFNPDSDAYSTFSRMIGYSLKKFKNWKVKEINGIDSVQYIRNYAEKHVGLARDPNVRYNIALGRLDYVNGAWKTFYGAFSVRTRAPISSHVNYTLEAPDGSHLIVSVPFLARKPYEFNSSEEYWSRWCLPRPLFFTNERSSQQILVQQLKFLPGEHYNPESIERGEIRSFEQGKKFSIYRPFINSSMDAFYDIGDGVGVFKLSDFIGGFSANSIIQRWKEALDEFQRRNIKKLILDLSDNGGGLICLGYALANMLFPMSEPHNTDFISSDLFEALVISAKTLNETRSFFHYSDPWINPLTQQQYQSVKWMLKGPTYKRGGKISEYSFLTHLNCNDYILPINASFIWNPLNVVIVSNGMCGSTCALFARLIQEQFGVRTIGVGGIQDMPIAYTEFAGGQVFRYQTMMNEIRRLGISGDYVPKPFPIDADFSFTIREAYSMKNPMIPLEFVYAPAEYRMCVNRVGSFNPGAIWLKVKEMML